MHYQPLSAIAEELIRSDRAHYGVYKSRAILPCCAQRADLQQAQKAWVSRILTELREAHTESVNVTDEQSSMISLGQQLEITIGVLCWSQCVQP